MRTLCEQEVLGAEGPTRKSSDPLSVATTEVVKWAESIVLSSLTVG